MPDWLSRCGNGWTAGSLIAVLVGIVTALSVASHH